MRAQTLPGGRRDDHRRGSTAAPSMDEEERWRRGKDDGWLSAAHPVSPPDACRTGRHSDGGVYQCPVCLGAYGTDAGEVRKGTEGRTIPSGDGPAGGSDTPTHRTRMARPGPQARRGPLSAPPRAGIVRSAGRSTIETVARPITIRRWVRCYGHKHMATVLAYLMMPAFPRWDSGAGLGAQVQQRCRTPFAKARAESGHPRSLWDKSPPPSPIGGAQAVPDLPRSGLGDLCRRLRSDIGARWCAMTRHGGPRQGRSVQRGGASGDKWPLSDIARRREGGACLSVA